MLAIRERYLGILLVLAAGTLWSTVGIAVRLIEEASVWQILFFRSSSLSLFLVFVTTIMYGQVIIELLKNHFLNYVYGGATLFFAYAGGIYSIQTTSVANAMLLFGSAPIITAILAYCFIKEKINIATVVSIGIALIGITIMVFQKASGNNLTGNLAALGSAVAFSLFTINLRFKKNIEMMPSVFMSGIFGLIFTSIIIFADGSGFGLPKNDIAIALSMGVFQVGAGLVLYTLGSKSLPAAQLTLLSMGEVLLGPIWVWIFLSEGASINTLIGGIILLSAITYNALYGREL